MPHSTLKSALSNTLGALAYLFCLLQWVWAVVLYLPAILRSDFIKQFMQKPVAPPPITNQPVEISTVGLIFTVAIVVIVAIATIYIIIKMPYTIGKTGSKISHKATDIALPIVTSHKKLPPKIKLQLTARLLFITKISLCVIPFGIILLVDNQTVSMSRDIVLIIGVFTALGSLAFFGLQAASTKLLHINYRQVW